MECVSYFGVISPVNLPSAPTSTSTAGPSTSSTWLWRAMVTFMERREGIELFGFTFDPAVDPAACNPAFTFSPKVLPCVCFLATIAIRATR